jgi:hypothetical protein
MIQSLHILRKDIRHLWVDLTLYVALLVAFSVVMPNIWGETNGLNPALAIFAGLLKILIPVFWLVLIARLIHDESLVGDQQFWITRPYTWGSLVGAKLLFIVLCMVLPFALMQWTLLLQAGLNPLHAMGGQLTTLLYFALWVWLPFIAVASVTSTIQRMFMSMLAAVIFWGAVLTMLGSSIGPRMTPPYTVDIFVILSGGLLIGILLYQYATRDTLRSRIALVGTTALFVGLFWCFVAAGIPGPANMLVRHHYAVSTNPSLRLVFDPSAPPPPKDESFHYGKLVGLRLPVQMQGLDDSDVLDGENVSYTLDMPGYHYASPWRPLFSGTDGKMWMFIPQNAFDRVHGSNVRMHLSLVATRLVPGAPQAVTAADHFGVPGDGRCELIPDTAGTSLRCRFPFQIARRTDIRGFIGSVPCGSSGAMHPLFATISARSAGTSIDPLVQMPLHIGGAVCPGTQLSFVTYHAGENFRLELDIPEVSLDRYAVR